MIYLAFDRLFSHCGGQNSNKNPLEELNIALFKQKFWLLFSIIWQNFITIIVTLHRCELKYFKMSFKRVSMTNETFGRATFSTSTTPIGEMTSTSSTDVIHATPIRREKVWDFDFSDSTTKTDEKEFEMKEINLDDDFVPPSQVIDDDDDDDNESSAGTDIIMGTPEPQVKRIRLSTASRLLSDTTLKKIENSDQQGFEIRSAFPERKLKEGIDPTLTKHSETMEISDSEMLSQDENRERNVEKAANCNPETFSKWLKGLETKSQNSADISDESVDIASASSPSQDDFNRSVYKVNVFKPSRRRSALKTGLALALETMMKKRESERLLLPFVAPAERQIWKGKIILAKKMTKDLFHVHCKNLQALIP